jgi:DNA-binding winged helix-turn-helix (wHTH) protein/tetratricopeptide (TPR) repeat protein
MVYQFGECLLDVELRKLRRAGELVALEPLVFDLLEFLVRSRGAVVSKRALIDGVWAGRIVSDSTLNSRMSAARRAIGDNGAEQRAIRTVSRRGFQFIAPVNVVRTADDQRSATAAACRGMGIAVLRLASLGPEVNADGFGKGLVEEIITRLTRIPWLFVASRRATAAFDDWSVDIKQLSRDFGLRYALEGSIRSSQQRLLVSVRLTDLGTATHVWASQFDLDRRDGLDSQEEIGCKVAGAVAARLEREAISTLGQCAEPDDAVAAYMRGLGSIYRWSRDGFAAALTHLQQAIALEPQFADAYGLAAYCYVQRQSYGWIEDRDAEQQACTALARCAAESGADNALILARAAHGMASVAGDIDTAAVLIERARAIGPHFYAVWYVNGWINLFRGRHEEAIEQLSRAIQLGAHEPLAFKVRCALAYGYFFAGRHEEAIVAANSALYARPNYMTAMRVAAASSALHGRRAQARSLVTTMSRLDSNVRLSALPSLLPFQRAENLARWGEGLRLAGMPD